MREGVIITAALSATRSGIDWEMLSSISTLLAVLVALFAALFPAWLQRRAANARLRALGRIVVARLQDHVDCLSAALRMGSTQDSDTFNVTVSLALRAGPEQLHELMPHLEGFGAELASEIAQYIADLESMRLELTKGGGQVKRAPQDFFSLPDHSHLYQDLLTQSMSVRRSISKFVRAG